MKALAAVFNMDVNDSPEEAMPTQYEYRVALEIKDVDSNTPR